VWGLADCRDQFPNAITPGVYALNKLGESVRLNPFRRNVSRDFPKREQIEGLDSAQPGLKRLPPAYVLVDASSCIDPARCCVGETPFLGVEAVAEVDEVSAEVQVWFSPAEHDLPTVTVAQPLVQREKAYEFLPIVDLFEYRLGQVVENLIP
jgi:hypothetical protein